MLILGLSGGIASGKNLVCDVFLQHNCAIFDADKIAHDLMLNDDEVITQISKEFPQAFVENKINRQILSNLLFVNEAEFAKKIKILESILHPKIRNSYQKFLEQNKSRADLDFLVLNIPLLLESNAYKYDKLIAIKCDREIRQARYLNRVNAKNSDSLQISNLEELKRRFAMICNRQIIDDERLKKADYIIDNNFNIFTTIKQVKNIILLTHA